MRVGMILDKSFPPDPRVENEALALIEQEHEVFLFCLSYEEQTSKEDYQGIQIRRYPCSNFVYKLSALAYTLPWYTTVMANKIASFIQENAIEVLHIHDMRIADAALKANRSWGLPTLLDLHENAPEIMKYYKHVQGFPGKFLISPKNWKTKEESFIREVNKVLVVTEESKDEIIERVGVNASKILAIPNTVRTAFYENPILDQTILHKFKHAFVLLYIGDTALRRGLTTALEGLNLLRNEIPELQLVIVGTGSGDQDLKKRVAQLDLESVVHFEGWQSPSSFASYITVSDVGISPLHRNRHHDTTYANKLFQYMSFAKPVLVSDATAQKNLIVSSQAGLVHTEKDAGDFAAKLRILHSDSKLAKEMGVRAKELVVSKFNWKINSQNLGNLYDEINT